MATAVATLTVWSAFLLAPNKSDQMHVPAEQPRLMSDVELPALPLVAELSEPYSRLFRELELPSIETARVRRRYHRLGKKRAITKLALPPPFLVVSRRHPADLHAPAIHVESEPQYSEVLPLPVAQPTPYKAPENRFLRSLAKLAAPFKFLRPKRKNV
jgi:hypothetical protein